MALHMVRIHAQPKKQYTLSDVQTAVADWRDSHPDWPNDPAAHQVFERTDENGNTWLVGHFRFETTGDKTTILDDAESTLKSRTEWFRMGYHACDRDGSGGTECSGWSDSRESGTVPAYIPPYA